MKSIRRRLAVAGTIAALAGLAGVAYAAGDGAPSQPPAQFASAHGGNHAAISSRSSGKRRHKPRHRAVVAGASVQGTPLKTRASGHGRHGRGEREHEGRDDAVPPGVDA